MVKTDSAMYLQMRNVINEERQRSRRYNAGETEAFDDFVCAEEIYKRGALKAYYFVEKAASENYSSVVVMLEDETEFPNYLKDLLGTFRLFGIDEFLLADTRLPLMDIIEVAYTYGWKIDRVEKFLFNRNRIGIDFVSQPALVFKYTN